MNRYLIMSNYLANQLVGDLFAVIPLFVVSTNVEVFTFFQSIFTLLFFIKLRDFSRIFKKIEESFLLKPTTTNLVALLKLLFVILFVAHLCACVWIYEGY